MNANALRVLIASEDVEVRNRITRALRWEPGVNVVGQAHNAIEAVALVKTLRPEVTLVDSRLPYQVGLDGVRLSRMSGLDAAMTIVEQSPGAAVVVLNDPRAQMGQELAVRSTDDLVRYSGGTRIPVDVRELFADATATGELVFADLWVREDTRPRSRTLEIGDDVIACGRLAILGGLLSAATIIGLVPGAIFIGLGAAAVVSGFGIRLAARFMRRR